MSKQKKKIEENSKPEVKNETLKKSSLTKNKKKSKKKYFFWYSFCLLNI